MTAGVGDVANFLFGCSYVVPAGLIYRYQHKKTRTHAVAGMAAGVILTTVLACFVNAFVLLPAIQFIQIHINLSDRVLYL